MNPESIMRESDSLRPDGYGAKKNDRIHINTISETERAAKVNWLVTYKGMMITQMHTDSDINRMFREYGDAEIVPVYVSEVKP